ncbi:MAG: hypothetical protein V3R91_03270 [Myxococcota bacterium]
MAARKKAGRKKAGRKKAGRKKAGRKATAGEAMIISKSRVKAAATRCNVGATFYGALDDQVREAIKAAEDRALANGRKTLRPQDV